MDRKRLWGRAGSRCAVCNLELTQVERVDSIIGDEAHVRSATPYGPRHEPDYPANRLDRYENLILLCKIHHKLVDDNAEVFPTAELLDLKAKHERRVHEALETPKAVAFLPVTTGTEMMAMVSSARAYSLSHSHPDNAAATDAIGGFLESARDWGDISDDLGPAGQVDGAIDLHDQMRALAELDYFVIAGWTTHQVSTLELPMIVIRVVSTHEADTWLATKK